MVLRRFNARPYEDAFNASRLKGETVTNALQQRLILSSHIPDWPILNILHQRTIRSNALTKRIAALDLWSARRGIELVYVSGLIATRTNEATGKQEVLLVNGSSNGVRKPFWQFAGGKVAKGEDHIAALHRELHQEMGVTLPLTLTYLHTFVPKPVANLKKTFAIHAFALPGNCEWDRKKRNVTLGDDVDRMLWTSDPLRMPSGKPRVLTVQTDYMLRNHFNFSGPKNINTNADISYNGEPDRYMELTYPPTLKAA